MVWFYFGPQYAGSLKFHTEVYDIKLSGKKEYSALVHINDCICLGCIVCSIKKIIIILFIFPNIPDTYTGIVPIFYILVFRRPA